MPGKIKIGLFGGTFDPVHIGHLILAESVLNKLELQKIYFIPAHKHALKSNHNITEARLRLEMLNLSLKEYEYFEISDIELQRENTSYTIDTISRFQGYEKLENSELYYIIGYDNLAELHLWKQYEIITEMTKFVVVGRPGHYKINIPEKIRTKFIFPDTPVIEISSTIIRNLIRENKYWKTFVHPSIVSFIKNQNLYKD